MPGPATNLVKGVLVHDLCAHTRSRFSASDVYILNNAHQYNLCIPDMPTSCNEP